MANSFSDDGATGQDGVDAMFVILAAFIIFTMQSGFGLLESGKSFIVLQNQQKLPITIYIDILEFKITEKNAFEK